MFILLELLDSLKFLYRQLCHLKLEQFYFFLCDLYAFYFFFLPIAQITTLNTILNESGESRNPWLVPSLSGENFQSFIIKYSVSCKVLDVLYQVEEGLIHSDFSEHFITCTLYIYIINLDYTFLIAAFSIGYQMLYIPSI